MPHDLFGASLVRPSSVRSRRSSVVFVSILAHAAVLAAVVITPLIATDVLPVPQRAIEYFMAPAVMPVVPEPPRAPSPSAARAVTPDTAPSAPTEAPKGITPETGLETRTATVVSTDVPVAGAIVGIGSADIGRIEAPPPPPPMAPIHLHTGIRPPRKLVDVAPAYPAIARAAHVEGVVIIEATIDVRGNVEAARVLRPQPLLDQAALDAVRQWKFTPTLLSGVPVPVIMTVTVRFKLQ